MDADEAEGGGAVLSEARGIRLGMIGAQVLALLGEARRFAAERAAVDAAAHQIEAAPGLDVGILARRVLAVEQTVAEAETAAEIVAEAAAKATARSAPDLEALAAGTRRELEAALALPVLAERLGLRAETAALLSAGREETPAAWGGLFAWVFSHGLGRAVDDENFAARARSWLDEWLLGKLVAQALQDLGQKDAQRSVVLLKALVTHQAWFGAAATDLPAPAQAAALLETLLRDRDVQSFLGVNRFGGVLWYNQESFAELLHSLLAVAAIQLASDPDTDAAPAIEAAYNLLSLLQAADAESGYQVERLVEMVG
jgi:hypothetical protein